MLTHAGRLRQSNSMHSLQSGQSNDAQTHTNQREQLADDKDMSGSVCVCVFVYIYIYIYIYMYVYVYIYYIFFSASS